MDSDNVWITGPSWMMCDTSTSLRELGIRCPSITSNQVKCICRDFPELLVLDLRGCFLVDSEGLCAIGDLHKLRELRLNSNHHLDDDLLGHLCPSWPHLEVLDIRDTAVTMDGLSHLTQHCHNVTDIDVGLCRLDDTLPDVLQRMPKLQTVRLCNLFLNRQTLQRISKTCPGVCMDITWISLIS